MQRHRTARLLRPIAVAALGLASLGCQSSGTAGSGSAPRVTRAAQISHDVFFTLKPESVGEADALIAACERLRAVPGVLHLTAGERDPAATRDVNEQQYHVGLHVEFVDQAAYDVYGPHALHQELITRFGSTFQKVVVYDTAIGS